MDKPNIASVDTNPAEDHPGWDRLLDDLALVGADSEPPAKKEYKWSISPLDF